MRKRRGSSQLILSCPANSPLSRYLPAHRRLRHRAPPPPPESSTRFRANAVAPVAQFAPVRLAAASDTPAAHRAEIHTAPNASNALHEFSPRSPAPREVAP